MIQFLCTLRDVWRSWWSPYFKDTEGQPIWAGLLVTFLFSTAIALVLTAFAWVFSAGRVDLGRVLWMNFVISQCIGFSIWFLFMAAGRVLGAERIDGFSGGRRAAFFSVLPLVGVVLGYALGFTLLAPGESRYSFRWLSGWFVAAVLLVWAVLSLVNWRFFANKIRLAETEKQLAAEGERAAQFKAQAVHAQLQSLQAQIEPHFLFNTLANVASLIDTGPDKAKVMLARLIDLLRASLDASRSASATLRQELELVRAYLDILSIRMGQRLSYAIDVPDALADLRFPPLLLQPLVENALKHGLEPKVRGGRIEVRARATDTELRLEVADDGLGFVPTASSGVGLSNLRARLAAKFGTAAHLSIEERTPGTRVILVLPLQACAAAGATQPQAAAAIVAPAARAARCP